MIAKHAVSTWFDPDHPNTIWVNANGELLQFPVNEPGRLVAFLRQRGLRECAKGGVLRDPARDAWAKAWAEENRRKSRAEEEARKARERRADKIMKRKEALELLKLVGL